MNSIFSIRLSQLITALVVAAVSYKVGMFLGKKFHALFVDRKLNMTEQASAACDRVSQEIDGIANSYPDSTSVGEAVKASRWAIAQLRANPTVQNFRNVHKVCTSLTDIVRLYEELNNTQTMPA